MVPTSNQLAVANKIRTFLNKSKCLRVLIVNPPQFPSEVFDISMARSRRYFAFPPYGAGILAHQLLLEGYSAELIDINYEILAFIAKNQSVELNIEMIVKNWKQKLADVINSFNPDLIGISCMFTTQNDLQLVARGCKETAHTTPIIVGGVSLVHNTESTIRSIPEIDFVQLYESDAAFIELLKFINGHADESALMQLATLVDDQYIFLPERTLPSSPIIDIAPNYLNLTIGAYSSLGEIGAYRFWRKPDVNVATVLSNRGCRGSCSFCGVRSFCGPGVRSRDINAVVDEIQYLKETYDIGHFMWLDDDLFYNQKRAIALFNEISSRRLGMTWDATNGVMAASVSPEIIHSAVESGCIGLNLGIESGNSEILRRINKPATLDHYRCAAEVLRQFPEIFTRGFLIIGFPNETLQQILDTITFAKELSLDWYTVQLLCPLPSTRIYEEIAKQEINLKDSTNTSMLNYGSSHMGLKRKIEKEQKLNAKDFLDFFDSDLEMVPSKESLQDIWFIADYKINYERFLTEQPVSQLVKWRKLLNDVAERITLDNPLANYFLGEVEKKLGNIGEARRRNERARKYLAASSYWRKRFDALGLSFDPI
jgi:magnesium-protoporphyrin IX monomethyl ester (oxidative) cyclase